MIEAWMLAVGTAGFFAGGWTDLATWAVTMIIIGVLTAVISSRIATQRTTDLSDTIKSLAKTVEGLASTLTRHERELGDLAKDRANCELRAARSFTTRAELARMFSDAGDYQRRTHEKLDKVHGRITDLASNVSNLNGQMAAAKGVSHGRTSKKT